MNYNFIIWKQWKVWMISPYRFICFCFTSAHTQWNNIFMTMNCSIIIYIYNYHYYLYIFTVIFLYFRVLAALFIVTFTERGNYTVTFIVKLTVTYWQQVSSSCCNVNDCKNNCNIFFFKCCQMDYSIILLWKCYCSLVLLLIFITLNIVI